VGDTAGARLIRPGDLEAFTRAVLRFVEDRELRERVRQEGRRWARRYDWEKVAVLQEEFYLRTLSEGQNSGSIGGSQERSVKGLFHKAHLRHLRQIEEWSS
jgi:glycosyltransferase involved in cell wall biosynthesis